jgi:hypothetical protein
MLAAGCGEGAFQPGLPLEGTWGADRVLLVAEADGATLEYDCAAGVIDDALVPGDDGRFDLAGTHTFGHGGPIQIGEDPDTHPARYQGIVSGNTLVLTVTITDTSDVLGPYRLIRGDSGQLTKCL